MVYSNDKEHERGYEKKELNYLTDDGLNIAILFEAIMVKQMGLAIDTIRNTGMEDTHPKQFAQLSRTIKDSCYDKIKFAKAILKDHNIE